MLICVGFVVFKVGINLVISFVVISLPFVVFAGYYK